MGQQDSLPNPIQVVLLSTSDYATEHIEQVLARPGFGYSELAFSPSCNLVELSEQADVLLVANREFLQAEEQCLLAVRRDSTIPLLAVTYNYQLEQCNRCFEMGGDDIVVGPKHLQELPSRIIACLRRQRRTAMALSKNELLLDELYLNRQSCAVSVAGQSLSLTPVQFSLLWLLATYRSKSLDKAFLYQHGLNKPQTAHDRSLDMHISRVRKKLGEAGWSAERIRTVHGVGYCLT
ncbi:response regulator transcription factor [Aliagarivorans taiwanensis]|uniref:response regulator transcription factor n=1 Tax=Aliagarivorans taiwanensis TaxID=561966 RepID=UPI0004026B00|nr:response regulator transcription factor [Aliagarivorans taiwanensis]